MLQNDRAIQNNDGPPVHNLRSGSVKTIHGDHNAVTMDAAAMRELTNALQAMSVPQDMDLARTQRMYTNGSGTMKSCLCQNIGVMRNIYVGSPIFSRARLGSGCMDYRRR